MPVIYTRGPGGQLREPAIPDAELRDPKAKRERRIAQMLADDQEREGRQWAAALAEAERLSIAQERKDLRETERLREQGMPLPVRVV